MNWIVLAVLSSVATAFFVAFGGAATTYMSSATMNAVQASAMLVTTLGLSFASGSVTVQRLETAVASRGLPLAVAAGVASGLAWITFFAAESRAEEVQAGSAARVAAINATYIVLLAVVDPLVRSGPPVTVARGAGILLVLAGNVLVLLA